MYKQPTTNANTQIMKEKLKREFSAYLVSLEVINTVVNLMSEGLWSFHDVCIVIHEECYDPHC